MTDETKRKLKDANGKDEDENDSPLKTQPMQKRHFARLSFLQPLFCDALGLSISRACCFIFFSSSLYLPFILADHVLPAGKTCSVKIKRRCRTLEKK